MKPNAVLVLGSEEKKNLMEAIFDIGFTPLVRKSMEEALDELRHECFAAVIVDGEHLGPDVDLLEFILNMRDIRHQTPVFVLALLGSEQTKGVILSRPNIFLLSKPYDLAQIATEMEKGLATKETQDG